MSNNPILEFVENLLNLHPDMDFDHFFDMVSHSGIDVSSLTPQDIEVMQNMMNQHSGQLNLNNHHDVVSFGSSKAYNVEQAEYYENEARKAYDWYESYIDEDGDNSLSKAKSYLDSYENYKSKAESYRNAAKWADE